MSISEPPIREPEELYAPHGDEDQIRHLVEDHLTEEGRSAFLSELMMAMQQAKAEGDLSHINRVLEAWTRTAMVVSPQFEANWERAQKATESATEPDVLSLDDVRKKLGIAK